VVRAVKTARLIAVGIDPVRSPQSRRINPERGYPAKPSMRRRDNDSTKAGIWRSCHALRDRWEECRRVDPVEGALMDV
jgi:hypothetical protein